jgi:hypothetical protein
MRTDSTGTFQFKDLVPNTYRMRAERRGFATQLYGQRGSGPGLAVTVGPGQRLSGLDFRLERAGLISGTVYEEDHEPVEGLEVAAMRVHFRPGGKQQAGIVRTTRTDDVGNYRLPGLAPGFYLVQAAGRGQGVGINLMASAFGYAPLFYPNGKSREEAAAIKVTAGGETAGINLYVGTTPTYSVRGVIVDSLTPSIERRYTVGFARGGGSATVEAPGGAFTLRGLAPGTYTLVGSVSSEGKAARSAYQEVRIVDSDARVVIEIGNSAELRGSVRIVDAEDLTLESLGFSLNPEREDAVTAFATTDASGKLMFRDLPAGDYNLDFLSRRDELYLKEVRCGTENYTAKPLPIKPQAVIEGCSFVLSGEVSLVTGQVSEGEKPAVGFVVVLIPTDIERRRIPRHTMAGQTDRDGQFRIAGVIPGDYYAFAVLPSDDAIYYDMEFAERNRNSSVRVTFRPKELSVLTLKPTTPQ